MLALGMTGCSVAEQTDTTDRDKALELIGTRNGDLTAPDQALLTYTKWANAEEEANCYWAAWSNRVAGEDRFKEEKQKARDQFFTGQAIEGLAKVSTDLERCLADRPQMRIDVREVKMEAPTRAIVLANLRNVTPIPETSTLPEFLREARANGDNYRYQMNLVDGVWKIGQIYTFSEYGNPQWTPYFGEDYGRSGVGWIVSPI